jgi:hypothetical protein
MSGRLRLGAGIDHPIDALAIFLLVLQVRASFLRTIPALKLRTGACQAVAYMMAVMVAPLGRPKRLPFRRSFPEAATPPRIHQLIAKILLERGRCPSITEQVTCQPFDRPLRRQHLLEACPDASPGFGPVKLVIVEGIELRDRGFDNFPRCCSHSR